MDAVTAVHPHTVLEMMHQTAVVQIDRADHGDFIVGEVAFRMDEAGFVFVADASKTIF